MDSSAVELWAGREPDESFQTHYLSQVSSLVVRVPQAINDLELTLSILQKADDRTRYVRQLDKQEWLSLPLDAVAPEIERQAAIRVEVSDRIMRWARAEGELDPVAVDYLLATASSYVRPEWIRSETVIDFQQRLGSYYGLLKDVGGAVVVSTYRPGEGRSTPRFGGGDYYSSQSGSPKPRMS